MEKLNIIVVDDEKNIRRSMQLILTGEGHEVTLCADSIKAFELLREQSFDVAIFDIRLNDQIDGIGLYKKIRAQNIMVPVIFISGNASLSEAAATVREGAYDFLEKPVSPEKLLLTVTRCHEYYSLQQRYRSLLLAAANKAQFFIGDTVEMKKLRTDIEKCALVKTPVLISGEIGSGRHFTAQMIHQLSSLRNESFTRLRGENFTFENWPAGTVYIDEIGDVPAAKQSQLLDLLQTPIGPPSPWRFIVSTTKNVAKDLKFCLKDDLYYQLQTLPLKTIPLREHPEDIALLAQCFLGKKKTLSTEAIMALSHYPWPGNITELKNTMERLLIMTSGTPQTMIELYDLPAELFEERGVVEAQSKIYRAMGLKEFRELVERDYIIKVLRQEKGNITRAAQVLDLERTFLHKKLASLGIEKCDYFE